MSHVIISGVHRSGTTLFMRILKAHGLPCHVEPHMESTQESQYVWGINEDNRAGYEALTRGTCLKIIHDGLLATSKEYHATFKRVIYMVRNWRTQSRSYHELDDLFWLGIYAQSAELQKFPKEEFLRDVTLPFGSQYALCYLELVLSIAKGSFRDKLVLLPYEALLDDPGFALNVLEKQAGICLDMQIMKDLVARRPPKAPARSEREFHPGFFNFLDILHGSVATNSLSMYFQHLCRKWNPIIVKLYHVRRNAVKAKYGLDVNKLVPIRTNKTFHVC